MAIYASNAPSALSLNEFMRQLDGLGNVAKSCRFAVRIMPSGPDSLIRRLEYQDQIPNLLYVCDAVEFPGRGFGVNEVRYYGASQAFPNNVQYEPCNMSFICRNSGLERQFFDDWQDIVNPTSSFNFNYANDYFCDIEIFQYSEIAATAAVATPTGPGAGGASALQTRTPGVIYSWKLHKCWPTLVSPQQVTWADSADILRLQVTVAYKYWDRPNNRSSISFNTQA